MFINKRKKNKTEIKQLKIIFLILKMHIQLLL